MADRTWEPRPQRWPLLLLLVGTAGLLPWPSVARASAALEELLLSVRRWVDPAHLASSPDAALARSDGAPSDPQLGTIDATVRSRLERVRAHVLPPSNEGWQRDGRFGAVPVGRTRTPSRLALASATLLPPDEPLFVGRALVGFTSSSGDPSRATPLLAKSTRLAACAGVPGEREARFVAIGDGTSTLAVTYLDERQPVAAGDLVWAVDPPSPAGAALARRVGGAWLGRLVRGEGAAGAERRSWRVAPLAPVESLAEVAVRLPPGFPAPSETSLLPLATSARRDVVVDDRRDALLLPVGRERGVAAGSALSRDGWLVGRVARSGWRLALARTVADPTFAVDVLLLGGGDEVAAFEGSFEGSVDGREGAAVGGAETIALAAAPPFDSRWDGALVVTAASADGMPEGLLVGTLRLREGHCVVERRVDGLAASPTDAPTLDDGAPCVVHRPLGDWSDEP
jgi:hypothetical protein